MSLQVSNPADDAFPVSTSDTVDLPVAPRFLSVSGAGNLKVTTRAGNTVTIAVPAGTVMLGVTRVWATGTTATGITAYV